MRKAQQKTRNRTAVTSYPNGMHNTLLELDAVAQIEKSKRKRERTRLAWEDPAGPDQDHNAEEDDDDVPLGVLYPEQKNLTTRAGRAAVADWDKPLGLLERRELEDNEPLSRRRNRLRGISPDHHLKLHAQQQAFYRQQEAAALAAAVPLPGDPEEEEHVDEPLAQRRERMKRKEALNSALGDLAGDDSSRNVSAFTEDILNHFGSSEKDSEERKSKTPEPTSASTPSLAPPAPIEQEEVETLGQRRARLQRERLALQEAQRNVSDPLSTGASTIRPPLHTSVSLANLLAVHPVAASSTPRNKRSAAAGTLLGDNAAAEVEARRKLTEQNARSTSYNVPRPVMHTGRTVTNPARSSQQFFPNQQQQFPVQSQQQYPYMAAGTGMPMYPQFAQPTAYPMQQYNNYLGAGGYANYGQPNMQPYNSNPHAGMGAQLQRQMMSGGAAGMGVGATGSYAALGYDEMSLSQGQRDLIDRWRLSVAQ